MRAGLATHSFGYFSSSEHAFSPSVRPSLRPSVIPPVRPSVPSHAPPHSARTWLGTRRDARRGETRIALRYSLHDAFLLYIRCSFPRRRRRAGVQLLLSWLDVGCGAENGRLGRRKESGVFLLDARSVARWFVRSLVLLGTPTNLHIGCFCSSRTPTSASRRRAVAVVADPSACGWAHRCISVRRQSEQFY